MAFVGVLSRRRTQARQLPSRCDGGTSTSPPISGSVIRMTTVAVFPPVLGVRQGTFDAAEVLRTDGHDVLIVDPFDGRTFDDYAPAMTYAWEELGQSELLRRALEGASDVPDGFVALGFSLGCLMAGYVATQRKVSGVVMLAGAIPVSALGQAWPRGVPAQTHSSVDDPWREQEEIDQAVLDVEATGGSIEAFDYPGAGHLFTDLTLSDEYDPEATHLLWSRVLPFIARLD